VDHALKVGIVRFDVRRFDLIDVLPGILQRQQRRRLQPALLGRGRQGAIAARCVLALGPQLIPQTLEEQVPEGVGGQPAGIERGGISDELVALENCGDVGEVVLFEAVSGNCAEE